MGLDGVFGLKAEKQMALKVLVLTPGPIGSLKLCPAGCEESDWSALNVVECLSNQLSVLFCFFKGTSSV